MRYEPLSIEMSRNPLLNAQLDAQASQWAVVALAILIVALSTWALFYDYFRGHTIPDMVAVVGIIGGLIALPFVWQDPWSHLLWGLAAAVVYLVLALASWFGLGDVKMAAAMGVWFGKSVVALIFWSWMLAGVFIIPYAIYLRLRKRSVRRLQIAFGPYMAMASVLGVISYDMLPLLGDVLAIVVLAGAAVWGLILEPRLRPVASLDELLEHGKHAQVIDLVPGDKPRADGIDMTDEIKLSQGRIDHIAHSLLTPAHETTLWLGGEKQLHLLRRVGEHMWLVRFAVTGMSRLSVHATRDASSDEIDQLWEAEMQRAQEPYESFVKSQVGPKRVFIASELSRSDDAVLACILVKPRKSKTNLVNRHWMGLPLTRS